MQTWLFQCNPNRFRIDQFLSTRPTATNWLVSQYSKRIEPGDQVFIWRAIGEGPPEASGIVAEAEVLTKTAPMPDNPAERPFWVDQTEAGTVSPRVSLRIVRIANVRAMIRRTRMLEDPILRDLRILRMSNNTNYLVTPEQATRLNDLWVSAAGVGRNPTWVRDELILALDTYLRYRGNPPRKESPEIVELSDTLNRLARYLCLTRGDRFRNANGVYMKLMNFRRFDPTFTESGRVGLSRGGRAEEEIWAEFAHDPERCRQVAETIKAVLASAGNDEIRTELAGEDIEEAEEGRVITALHRRYERNAGIVKAKKARVLATFGRLECEACGFDFHERYGVHGDGFIECHHTQPVHALRPGQKTRASDLKLLCANCHRMVHARRQWLSMEQLLAIVQGALLRALPVPSSAPIPNEEL